LLVAGLAFFDSNGCLFAPCCFALMPLCAHGSAVRLFIYWVLTSRCLCAGGVGEHTDSLEEGSELLTARERKRERACFPKGHKHMHIHTALYLYPPASRPQSLLSDWRWAST